MLSRYLNTFPSKVLAPCGKKLKHFEFTALQVGKIDLCITINEL